MLDLKTIKDKKIVLISSFSIIILLSFSGFVIYQNYQTNKNSQPISYYTSNYYENRIIINNIYSKSIVPIFNGQNITLTVQLLKPYSNFFSKIDINLTIGYIFSYSPNYNYSVSQYYDLNQMVKGMYVNQKNLTIILDYNQEIWPFHGYGVFKISYKPYNEIFYLSNVALFHYVSISKNLIQNTTINQQRITNLETRNLYAEVEKYIDLNILSTYDLTYGLLNSSTIEFYKNKVNSATGYYTNLNYTIFIGDFNGLDNNSITKNQISSILNLNMDRYINSSFFHRFYNESVALGETIDSGWICLQYLDYQNIVGPLNAIFITILQLTILDTHNNIFYFNYYPTMAVA